MELFIFVWKSENSSINEILKIPKSEQKRPTHEHVWIYSKSAYIAENPPNDCWYTFKIASVDFFPNVRKLPLMRATSSIISSEAEKARIKGLKPAFRSTIKDAWETNLNLTQMHVTGSTHFEEIVQMFVRKYQRRLLHHHWFLVRHKK